MQRRAERYAECRAYVWNAVCKANGTPALEAGQDLSGGVLLQNTARLEVVEI
jgi:hypothetical protein